MNACPRCWDKYQPGETFDFSKGNYPKKEKTEIEIESEDEKKLNKDCQSGITVACEKLQLINDKRIKKSIKAP